MIIKKRLWILERVGKTREELKGRWVGQSDINRVVTYESHKNGKKG